MFRRWWRILLLMMVVGPVLGIAGGAVVAFITPRAYLAKAVVQIADLPSDPNDPGGATHAALMRSRTALEKVATDMDLQARWHAPLADVVRILEESSSSEPIRGTSLVDVRVEYSDPRQAAEIANGIANGYVPKGGGRVILHEAAVPNEIPSSPKVSKLLATGFAAGALFGFLGGLLLMLIPRRSVAGRPAEHAPA
jgi:uncharacterized protein involved in exopolysaccharide biosynthesis